MKSDVPRLSSWPRWPRTAAVAAVLLLAASACAPAAAPSQTGITNNPAGQTTAVWATPATAGAPSSSGAGSSGVAKPARWETTLADARKEGQIICACPTNAYREAILEFTKAHPDIKLDYVDIRPADLSTRMRQERSAGMHLWDVMIVGATVPIELKPEGMIAPLRDYLILPEVLDDQTWMGGFDGGWYDLDKKYAYGFQARISYAFFVNRDIVPESQLSTGEQLLDPRWQGKVALLDPRQIGGGDLLLLNLVNAYGEARVRDFFRTVQPVVSSDYRQLAEWLLRGRYPIAAGDEANVKQLQEQLGTNTRTEPLRDPKLANFTSQWGVVAVIDQAPHPNATTILVNWLLSQDGQRAWAQKSRWNSRRLDVEVIDPDSYPERDKLDQYSSLNTEEWVGRRAQARDLARAILDAGGRR